MSKSRYDIVKIISETNFSEEYQENMKRFYPDFVLSEDMYKIVLYSAIYGNEKLRTVIWTKSKLDENKQRGYYLD